MWLTGFLCWVQIGLSGAKNWSCSLTWTSKMSNVASGTSHETLMRSRARQNFWYFLTWCENSSKTCSLTFLLCWLTISWLSFPMTSKDVNDDWWRSNFKSCHSLDQYVPGRNLWPKEYLMWHVYPERQKYHAVWSWHYYYHFSMDCYFSDTATTCAIANLTYSDVIHDFLLI